MDALAPVRDIGNISVEQSLLGALLINNDLYQRIASILSPEHFFDPLHGRIFAIMASRISAGDIVDARTIKSFLNANEQLVDITVRDYVGRLAGEAATFQVEAYARRIVADSVFRRLLDVARDAETAVLEREPDDTPERLLGKIEGEFAALRQAHHVGATDYSPARAVNRAMEMIGQAHRGERVGWPWLLRENEMVMNGPMQPGRLYGLLGCSGDGKTSYVLQSLRFLAGQGIPFLFLSGEQEVEESILQMQAQHLGIPLTAMLEKQGLSDEEAERIYEDAQALVKLPWHIEKWVDCTVAQLGLKIRNFVKRHGPGVVAIDNAKKIKPDNPRDIFAQQVSQEFNGTKDLMSTTGCAGLLLMQRNSDFLKRSNMWPIRQDCYGGEGTLQALDGCMTVFRPARALREALGNAVSVKDRERIEAKIADETGRAWFGSLKLRFGEENRRAKVEFQKRFTRFVSFEQRRQEREPELPV